MSKKTAVSIAAMIGLTVGGSVPMLWGGNPFDALSLLLGFVGGLLGVWAGVKINQYIG